MSIELSLFYLKYILWMPPTHPLIVARTIMLMLAGSMAVRETFQYLDDPLGDHVIATLSAQR